MAGPDPRVVQRLRYGCRWLDGGASYENAGFYAVAFAAGILFNLSNLILIGALVLRERQLPSPLLARA